MSVVVNLMSVMSPPPASCNLSARTVVKWCNIVVYTLGVSLVSCIVMIYACVSWISSLSSSSLFLILFMLTCSIMRFISLLFLYLCPCVVSVVIWSSLFCLWGCRVTLCDWGGCCDCDACTVVCVAGVYDESVRVRGWRQCSCGGWMRGGCGECRRCGWYMWFRYCV